MAEFTCLIDGCIATKHEARGLCRSHYRSTLARKPNKTVALNCDGCGVEVVKEVRSRRYRSVQCGDALCRRWLSWGTAASTPLPEDHWALMYGASCEWSPPAAPEPKVRTLASGQCADCDAWYITDGLLNRPDYCSPRCSSRASRRRRRARESGALGSFRYAEIIHLYLLAGRVCAYCEQAVEGLPDPEHVLPMSRGGRNDRSNLLASCRACNTDKGDLTLSEWATDRQRRGLTPLRTELDPTSPAFKHLVHYAPTGPAWRNREVAA